MAVSSEFAARKHPVLYAETLFGAFADSRQSLLLFVMVYAWYRALFSLSASGAVTP